MIRLPRIIQTWPWPREIHPLYEEIKGESLAWYLSTFPEIDAKLARTLTKTGADRLAALCYPYSSKEHLEAAADLLYFFAMIDTLTEPLDVPHTREVVDAIADALRNPNKARPTGEPFLGTVAQKFWARFSSVSSVTAQRHFIDVFCRYLESLVDQVHGRETEGIPTLDDYFSVRHQDIAAYPMYIVAEAPFDLPDEVYYHPVVVELASLTTDMIMFDNDIHSYNKEQSTLEVPYNIITVLMHQNADCSIDQAMEKAGEMYKERQTRFLKLWNELPSWGPVIDPIAKEYVQVFANWVRGNFYWQFECQRYFGHESIGERALETGTVKLLPKFNPMAVKVETVVQS